MAMLADNDSDIRNKAVDIIYRIRKGNQFDDTSPRKFIIPKLNWSASTYYENHTQSVERMIKVVSESSQSVCGKQKREGSIVSKLRSRKAHPESSSKKYLINMIS